MKNVSLKKYFKVQFKANAKALKIAHKAMNKRLDGMNEFRAALRDQASKFVTKDEYNPAHLRNEDDISKLREWRSNIEGRSSIAIILAALAIIIEIIRIFF